MRLKAFFPTTLLSIKLLSANTTVPFSMFCTFEFDFAALSMADSLKIFILYIGSACVPNFLMSVALGSEEIVFPSLYAYVFDFIYNFTIIAKTVRRDLIRFL
jgi:hypothetical protein